MTSTLPFRLSALFHVNPLASFDFEDYLTRDLGIALVRPKKIELCQNYIRGTCRQGKNCPFDHPAKTKLIVCKHWLRGLCKKGDNCEFLHEYNMKKMPHCWFYEKLGECTNPECLYLHIDPATLKKECAWYARGFCKHGPECRNKHVRKAICLNFLTGFCPKGPNCMLGHSQYNVPLANAVEDCRPVEQGGGPQQEEILPYRPQAHGSSGYGGGPFRPHFMTNQNQNRAVDEITCFKCNEKGHYANNCTKRRKIE